MHNTHRRNRVGLAVLAINRIHRDTSDDGLPLLLQGSQHDIDAYPRPELVVLKRTLNATFDPANEDVALIAHDAM